MLDSGKFVNRGFCRVFGKAIYIVIPAKPVPVGFNQGAGIQYSLKILDSGSPPGLRRGCPE
ncbi:MAG: hypothetical protein AMJ94_09860 [Deltaproteobacteria bacterium SM23_61]|nr:MAG: hypothetical protein AMJ94_09860 [Deltaproteobacteria bacterium SM23_61]